MKFSKLVFTIVMITLLLSTRIISTVAEPSNISSTLPHSQERFENAVMVDLSATPKFLTLPFNDPGVKIEQGWLCHEGQPGLDCEEAYGNGGVHQGIDFTKYDGIHPLDASSFPVLAAASGDAECESNNEYLGNNVTISHNTDEGDYYTRYSHLESCIFNNKYVTQGEYIGMASDTGSDTITNKHLHFSMRKLQLGDDPLIDPYALNAEVDLYPQPGTSETIASADHFWTTNPPSYPDNTHPSGYIIAPVNNSTISPSSVYIKADVWDNPEYGSGVKRVEFLVKYNGTWHHVKDEYYAPYEAYWQPPIGLISQDVKVSIKIEDHAGNMEEFPDIITLHYEQFPDGIIVVEDPSIAPSYGGGMCDSAWYRYSNNRGHYSYLTLSTNVPAQSTNSANWNATLNSGTYRVEAYIPTHSPISWQCPSLYISWDTSDARYTLYHATGSTTVSVNQSPLFNQWLDLGIYSFEAGNTRRVKLVDLNGEPNLSHTVSFSAVKFTQQTAPPPPDNTNPFGNITLPADQITVGPGVIYISADAWDNISGSGVKRVEFWVRYDGAWHRIKDEYQAPYEVNWNIPEGLTSQNIEIGLHVVDNAGNVAIDPGGKRIIHYEQTPTCSVPYMSQRDPRWKNLGLSSALGACSASCTIGSCGCTLTAANMIFNYYGSNLNPASLDSCMGLFACPFTFSVGAACSQSTQFTHYDDTRYISNQQFWNLLESRLQEQPVILGMHRGLQTHWVVVLDGYGNNPSNYTIHDPWPLNGANMKLSTYYNWNYDHIAVYSGQPNCNSSTVNNIIEPAKSDPLIIPDDNQFILPTTELVDLVSSSVITGSVTLYRMTDITMTLQLKANSNVGDVTEVLIWTDSMTDASWQPFSSYIHLPTSEDISVRFRDNLGNVSEIEEETRYPTNSPRTFEFDYVFLPVIYK